MPVPMTIEQAAEVLQVHPNTVRRYIAEEGLPTVPRRRGGKGRGNGAQVDVARLTGWIFRRDGSGCHWLPPDRNPLRDIAAFQHTTTLLIIGRVLAGLTVKGTYPEPLLTREQAKKAYAAVALGVSQFITGGRFEEALAVGLGLGNLDDAYSFIAAGDFRTEWKGTDQMPLPPEIGELFTDRERRELAKQRA